MLAALQPAWQPASHTEQATAGPLKICAGHAFSVLCRRSLWIPLRATIFVCGAVGMPRFPGPCIVAPQNHCVSEEKSCVRPSVAFLEFGGDGLAGWVGRAWSHGPGRSRALKGLQQVSPGPNAVAKPRSAAPGSFAETRPGWRHREILSTWPSVYPAKRHDALPRRVVLGVASSEGATTRRWRGTRGGAALCPGLTCLALLGPKSLPRRYSDDMRPERAAPGQPGAKRRGRGGARVQLVRRAGGH